jgi:TDG/mug DNA glycosylase family protein
MDEIKRSFPPVVDADTRLLILGSLPGELSLARRQYYGNARNQFWHLTGAAIGIDLTAMDYEARLGALRAAGIGLWDVVGSARRRGSLDGAIRDHVPNDLADLARSLPRLKAIAFNGGKSAALGRPLLAALPHLTLIPLPSSSPAFTMALAEKQAAWNALRDFVRVT